MKIRINTRPTIKASTLIIILALMVIALLCFAFSDSLPKPKITSSNTTHQLTKEEILQYEEEQQLFEELQKQNDEQTQETNQQSTPMN